MMVTAKALIVDRPGTNFVIDEVEIDDLKPSEVLVRVVATGICHTDIAAATGAIPQPLPMVFGHEGAGIIQQVGGSVTNVQVGDHVILSFSFCGSCPNCHKEKTFACVEMMKHNFGARSPDGTQNIRWKGSPVGSNFFGQSSFCNPAIVQSHCCVPVNKDYPLPTLAALGCGAQTGAGAVLNVIEPHRRGVKTIAIFGIGGVGCAAIMAAKAASISTIIAVDINESRLDLARALGATKTFNSANADIVAVIKSLTKKFGVDAAVDCTGVISVVETMLEVTSNTGMGVSIGNPKSGSATISIVVAPFIGASKTYRGSIEGDSFSEKFIPFLAKLHSEGKFPLELTQRFYKVDEVNQAVQDMLRGDVVKPILLWE